MKREGRNEAMPADFILRRGLGTGKYPMESLGSDFVKWGPRETTLSSNGSWIIKSFII